METRRRRAAVVLLVAVIGCRGDARYVAPESPMPANTILLSQMMRELAEKPGFTDNLLNQLNRGGRQGPALLTPALFDRLRQVILGKDWNGLNRFPRWTMAAIAPTVQIVGRAVAKGDNKNPIPPAGPPTGNPPSTPAGVGTPPAGGLADRIDLGTFALNRAETVSLDKPSPLAGFIVEREVTDLGNGVTRGDGPNPALAPLHAESERLAYVLNRLSLNALQNTAIVTAQISNAEGSHNAITPQALIEALMATHTVVVSDARYFANFGHFHFNGREVMMPFWIDSQIRIPHTRRPLLVPVAHAEYQWHIRGPKINADVSYYFGIDGKAQFRTMDTLDQAWVLGRHAHEYRGADAIEVTRLVGLMVVAYARQHLRRPDLPFGGYFTLGVCQDSVAAIEKKMTGRDTLFPNTADDSLFDDPRDAEVNALMRAIPADRGSSPPAPERIFGSLPTYDFNAITIPGLADDLNTVNDAWQWGELNRTHTWIRRLLLWFGIAAALLAVYRFLRRPKRSPDIHVHRTK